MNFFITPARWLAPGLALSFVLSFVLSFALSAAHAQSVAELKEVVVTATRVAQPLTDVLADVSVIDSAQLEQAGMQSLLDVLAQLPGVQISSNGSYRSSSGVFLRGASSSQTLLLVNGMRVGSATLGSYSLESLPLDRIERVEVLRGAAAALYGPDAVGGVIQVFTREPQEGVQRSATVGVGSDGQRKIAAALNGQEGAWGYGLGATHEQARGINVKRSWASGFNADADGFDYNSLDANLSYQINRQHALSAQLLVSDGKYHFDGAPFPNPLGLNAGNAQAVAYPKLEQQVLKWTAQFTQAWSSSVSLGHTKEVSVSRYFRMTDSTAAGDSRFDTTRNQLVWQNDIRFDKDVLSLIAEQREDAVDSTTAYTVTQRKVDGLAASYALRREVWDSLFTVRRDNNSQFGAFTNHGLSAGYQSTLKAPSFRAGMDSAGDVVGRT